MRKETRKGPPAGAGETDGVIEGRNAVIEALRAGTAIDKIYLAKGETDAALGHIASTARSKGVVVVETDRRKLDYMSRTLPTRGSSPWRRSGNTPRWRTFWPGRRSGERRP